MGKDKFIKTGIGNKVDGGFIMTQYFMDVNRQILKLPAEIRNIENNMPTGTKYEDIVRSYCNGVDVLEEIIMGQFYTEEMLKEYIDKRDAECKGLEEFALAKRKVRLIVRHLDKNNMFNAHTASVMLDEDDEGNVYGED